MRRDRRNLYKHNSCIVNAIFIRENIWEGGQTLKFTEFIVCARPLEILI